MSFFSKLKEKITGKKADQYLSGFKRTNTAFKSKFSELAKDYRKVDQAFLEEVMVILLESDVGLKTAEKIVKQLEKRTKSLFGMSFDHVMDEFMTILSEIYGENSPELTFQPDNPTVILLVGVNGSGKTTSCAKLIKHYQDQGKKVAVVAADTFRAGAIDQLARWAQRFDVPCIKGRENGDPSAAIVDGCRYAKEHQIDVLLCDTAGRLQNKQHLMAELSKMHRVMQREIPTAPNAVWLVLDATTGQNGLSQAEVFLQATQVTGIILTKMDGTAKGGIVLGIKDQLKIPVVFIGMGEKPEDLHRFDINAYLYSLAEGVYRVEED